MDNVNKIKQTAANKTWCVLKVIVSPFGDDMLAGASAPSTWGTSPVLVPRKNRGTSGSGRQEAGNQCSRGSRPGGQRSVCGGWGVRFVDESTPVLDGGNASR